MIRMMALPTVSSEKNFCAEQDDAQHADCHQRNDRNLTEYVRDVRHGKELAARGDLQADTQNDQGKQRPKLTNNVFYRRVLFCFHYSVPPHAAFIISS